MRFSGIVLFVALVIGNACVDRIDFAVGESDSQIVVDGQITNEPGPYTIKLTRSLSVDDNLRQAFPFSADRVIISDDAGNMEQLHEVALGVYQTNPVGLRGEVGRSYTLRIEARDGSVFTSTPEKMEPPGEIDSLYFVFEQVKPQRGPTSTGFRVFVDAQQNGEEESYFRWEFNGVFKTFTYPELRKVTNCSIPPGAPAPPPCSTSPCTCCTCWVSQHESKPTVSDGQFVSQGVFKNVEVGYVPVDQWTFQFRRYQLEVIQMSLSKTAFEYWKIIRDQKEGATSLFQPAFGKLRSNISSSDGSEKVTGIFYASAVSKKYRFITESDLPVPIPQPSIDPVANCALWEACDKVFDFATTTEPEAWK